MEADPWLAVPLSGYERHMEAVRQLGVLADLFAEALAACRPASVAVLGVAGGNGLDRIDPRVTARILGIDINPGYLAETARRYRGLPGLELHAADLSRETVSLGLFELVHAALIFEHAGIAKCLDNALALVAPGGFLSVVLQQPEEPQPSAGIDRSVSLAGVALHYTLHQPAAFCRRLGREPAHRCRREVANGWFWHAIFAAGRVQRE